MEFRDYYRTMGVEPGASADEIKRAYRKLARRYHPDVSDEPDAEAKFKELGEAYEVLRDPEKRKQYDAVRAGGYRQGDAFRPGDTGGFEDFDFSGFGAAGEGGAGFGGADFSDFFETLFGGARRRGRRQRGQDLHATVEIDLETAHAGGTRRIRIEQPERAADGTLTSRTRSLDVRIPAGMTEGRQIRLAGKGAPGAGDAPPGDLYLEVRIKRHRLFELEGRDVHLVLPIAPWEAALGARIDVPTLEGRVTLSIPAGAASGKRLRLRGRGLPGDPPGDQYVTLKVAVPEAADDTQRELYERLRETQRFHARDHLEN
ncbi:MAG: DnaJ C-terminal domain-containing protein [Wenzhouxiangellaceae bacterium]|nr:DnaJ C-terminal domain-containing protein [Wenzhouxiangellaceae bacterium]